MGRIQTNGSVVKVKGNKTNTFIGAKETFLDRNAKLVPSDETTTALTNMNWIAGHHTVSNLNGLYNIPDFILSQECYANKIGNGADAIGQLWYVEDEKRFYQLVYWEERRNSKGWSLSNIQSAIIPTTDDIIKVNASYFNTNTYFNIFDTYNFNAYSKYYIKEKDNEWITSITMYGDGTYTYTTDGLHLNKSTSTYTYSKDSSTSSFDVIDSIEYNPTNSSPHQLTYNVKTVNLLSQNHHGGSFKGDFLTSATMSSTGTLSGTTGKFTNKASHKNVYPIVDTNTEKENIPVFLDTAVKGTSSERHYSSYIITNVSIDSTGKLSYSQAMPRDWVHDNICVYNDSNNVWYTYFNNGNLNVGYIPIANVSGKDINSYEYTAGVINSTLLKKYESRLNNLSNDKNTLNTYVIDAYSYVRNFIDKHALLDNINTYQGSDWSYIGYNVDGKLGVAYLKPASSSNQGPLSAYTYNFFEDYIADIENRLTAQPKTKALPQKNGAITVKIYAADKTSLIKTYASSSTNGNWSIPVEYGSYITIENMYPWWLKPSDDFTEITSTSGDWGSSIPSINNMKYNFTPKNIALQSLNSMSKNSWSQTITGATTYGVKSFVINSFGNLVRKDAVNTYTSNTSTFTINSSFTTIRWWGCTSENPKNWSGNITNKISIIKNGGSDKINNKGKTIPGTQAKTDSINKYFVYIYRKNNNGILTSASVPGADATEWFNTKTPIPVTITSSTNKFTDDYYLIYSRNENALAGAELTFA